MALTRPKAAQINFDLTNITDPVIRLNSDHTGANDTDVGFIFERGSTGDNAVLIWDESADQFVLGTTTAIGTTQGDLTVTNGNLQVDTLKNREQRYTTSNMLKFNQLYTGAAIGSYFEQNEYQKIVTITPDGDSQNYQVSGRILVQNAGEIQTINFIAALRSNTLPDLDWSISYTEEHNGTAHFKPQLWTKETTTAGFIFAIQKISSGSLYGTVTVDLDVIPRTSALLDNVTVNTTQDSEQTAVDAGFTANDMTLVRSQNGSNTAFSGDLSVDDADDQIIHGDTNYNSKEYVLYGSTTDATETEIFVGGTTNSRIPVASNTTIFYQVYVVARRTDATGESAGIHLKGVVDNFSGTVADVGDVYEVIVARDDANYLVDARADDTNDAIGIHVTGVAGKTISWTAIVKTHEVAQ
jgi:hypothetical protein